MSLRVDADKPTPIQDLGITVGPGSVWVEQEDLNRSTCLQALIRLGQVRVSSNPRCRVSKDPPKAKIHTVGMSRPSKVPRSQTVHKTTHHKTTEVVKEGVTAEQAQDMVNKAASNAAAQAIAAMTEQMQNFIAQSSVGEAKPGIEQIVQQAVSQALQSAQIARPVSTTLSGSGDVLVVNGPEEPLFIPTGIVRADTESLEVQSESSADAGGLDDAATALKALRKKKS